MEAHSDDFMFGRIAVTVACPVIRKRGGGGGGGGGENLKTLFLFFNF